MRKDDLVPHPRSRLRPLGFAGLSLLSLSCGEELWTESGRIRVQFAGLHVAHLIEPDASHPVLQGTRLCPSLFSDADSGGIDLSACFTASVEDGGELDGGGCFTPTHPGLLRWRFEPTDCDVGSIIPEAESLTLQSSMRSTSSDRAI